MANRIDNPELRDQSKFGAVHWWGLSCGGYALKPDGRTSLNLSKGFPDDWGPIEIRGFSCGLMVNFAKSYPELIAIAKTDAQRQTIYEGVIRGSVFSQPAIAAPAVENVALSYVSSESGRLNLRAFIQSWDKADAKAAGSWLDKQPANLKTEIMRDALDQRVKD